MAGKRAKRPQTSDAHRWVVSYADFITLLFAFFVVMYAISSVNVSKYRTLAKGMHNAFNSHGKQAPVKSDVTKGKSGFESDEEIEDPFEALSNELSSLQDSDYHINVQDGYIELDIKAGALFDSGSAELRPEAMLKIMKIAEMVKDLPYPLTLEGYTDNIPIDTPQYPSNWELSSARAASLARFLTAFGVQPNRLTVTGFGEQYPLADNADEAGRAKNRRVNMVIARDRSVPRLMNPGISLVEHGSSAEVNYISELPPIPKEFK